MSLENGANDVNNASTSSVDQNAANVVHNTETESKGALSQESVTEPLNQEENPKTVPYERFQEINKKFRETEKRAKDLEEKYNSYKDLDSAITTNPKFAAKINKVIEDFNTGKIDADEAQEKIDNIEGDQAKVQSKASTNSDVDSSLRVIHQEFYINSFEKMVGADFEDEADRKAVQAATEMVLDRLRPGWINKYDGALLNKAYKEAKGFLEEFSGRRIKHYTEGKAKDVVPSSKPGIPAITEKKVVSAEDAISVLAEGMKAFKE